MLQKEKVPWTNSSSFKEFISSPLLIFKSPGKQEIPLRNTCCFHLFSPAPRPDGHSPLSLDCLVEGNWRRSLQCMLCFCV